MCAFFTRFIPTHVGLIPVDAPQKIARRFIPTHVGLMLGEVQIGNFLRFIPTHVGLILREIAFEKGTTVHPHACGVNTKRKFEFYQKTKKIFLFF